MLHFFHSLVHSLETAIILSFYGFGQTNSRRHYAIVCKQGIIEKNSQISLRYIKNTIISQQINLWRIVCDSFFEIIRLKHGR